MKKKTNAISCAILITLLASCNKDGGDASSISTVPAAAPSAAPAPPAPSAKVDVIKPDDLKAGLMAMEPRVTKTVDGFKKVEPLPNSRYFMHPTMEKDASIEFDTTGISSMTLSPYMEDFSSSADCTRDPEAGIVKFSWTLDDGQSNNITVDRNYTGPVDIDVSNTKRLKLDVNKGNDVITCDWFSVGFLNVKTK